MFPYLCRKKQLKNIVKGLIILRVQSQENYQRTYLYLLPKFHKIIFFSYQSEFLDLKI
jgi:hypothetical protein